MFEVIKIDAKSDSDVTLILKRIESGDTRAPNELLPLVYDELRTLAAARMAQERSDHTLQATALVHEAYLRLAGDSPGRAFQSKKHFFAAASQAMRRILIDHARRKNSLKRGSGYRRVDMSPVAAEQPFLLSCEQLLELDDLLEKLKTEDAPVAELVSLRLYAGLSVTEAAEAMGISRSLGYQFWDYATSWFAAEMQLDQSTEDELVKSHLPE